MRLNPRSMVRVGLAALAVAVGVGIGIGASPARAQGWTTGGTPVYSPSTGTWYIYPRTSAWGGYVPGTAWGGYAPAPAPQPPASTAWGGYAPGTAWSGYAPASGVPAGSYAGPYTAPTWTAPAPAYVQTPRVTTGSRSGVSAPHYGELGTGRPVSMFKPWLPGQ